MNTREHVAQSLPAFEAWLSGLTELTTAERADIAQRDDRSIRLESANVSRTLRRFAVAVCEAMESPRCADDFLRHLDLRMVSRDHNWRQIFSTLVNSDVSFDGHKRVLLIKYLQYLSTRKQLLEAVSADRQSLEETEARQLPWRVDNRLRRLPVGETITIRISELHELSVGLGAHQFTFHVEDDLLHLTDVDGHRYLVRPGRNMVGRHPECDLSIAGRFRNVSRVHAIFDWQVRQALRITDLSTKGTFLSID